MVTEQKELWPVNTTDLMFFWKPTMFLSITDIFVLWETVGGTCSTAALHGHQTMTVNFTGNVAFLVTSHDERTCNCCTQGLPV